MVMCTLLAGGGVFFAAGEPIYHLVVTPPAFETEAGTAAAVAPALAQSFMHLGFLAWAVLGSLTAIVLAYAHYNQGKPLQPRTLLYPVFGGWMAAAILLLTTIFVATTGDSMSYSIAVVGAGHDEPHFLIRAFWGGAMATMAGILLYMGEGQIGVLQQFIVITAIPVSVIILPSLWAGPQAAMAMAREQKLV